MIQNQALPHTWDGITLILQGFLCVLQLLLKRKKQKQNKSKKQNVDSTSSCSAFLSFGDSAEKSLRLKSFHLIYALPPGASSNVCFQPKAILTVTRSNYDLQVTGLIQGPMPDPSTLVEVRAPPPQQTPSRRGREGREATSKARVRVTLFSRAT